MTNTNNLLTLANNHLWDFGLDWLEVPENQVLQLVSDYGDDLAITAAKLKREFTIKWGDGECDRINISPTLINWINSAMSNSLLVNDSIFLNPNSVRSINIAALKAMEKLITWNEAGHAAGMVNSKGIQVWVNELSGKLFNAEDPNELTAIDTSVYWHPGDRLEVQKELSLLAPGQHMVYTYRARADEHWDSWLKLTNRFEVVEFGGQRYRLSLNLENQAIAIPDDLRR